MVLADLGGRISAALARMTESVIIDEAVLKELLDEISRALLAADVDVLLVKRLLDNIKKSVNLEDAAAGHSRRRLIESTVIKELYKLLDSETLPYNVKKGQSNVIMFVGLQGAGKTTSCTKYAYFYKRKGYKVALVCADTFRAGAYDQLKQNATKARIPFYGSYSQRDPVVVAQEGVQQFRAEKFEVIIVDTSGRHKQEAALFEEMKAVAAVVQPDDVVFVMDSSIGQAAKAQAVAFKQAVDVGSVIITKLDGHAKGGGALSAVAATNSPIIFVGTGEHIENFEQFVPKSFVSRLLGKGDISGLLNLFEERNMLESQQELVKKLTQGTGDFTFRDMYAQFENLTKMGPLSQVISMIPGLNNVFGSGRDADAAARIRRFMIMMDSMTEQELDGNDKIFSQQQRRLDRVARGSGCDRGQVDGLMNTFKPLKQIFSKMKELTGGGSKGGMDPRKLMGKSGQLDMRKMASMFNPQMIQQMGGMGNLQKMMQQFGDMDMGAMAQQMGGMGLGGMGGQAGGQGGRRTGGGKQRR